MNYSTSPKYEVKLWIGSVRGYNGKKFLLKTLLNKISDFQKGREDAISLAVTSTTFIFKDYIEDGWEIAARNYPRFPQPPEKIDDFMMRLAQYLLVELEQNRITISDPKESVTLESDTAEEHPKPKKGKKYE